MSQATKEERNGLNVKMFNEALIKALQIKKPINWVTDQKQLWTRYIGILKVYGSDNKDVSESSGDINAVGDTMAINNKNAVGYAYLLYLSLKFEGFEEFIRNYHKRCKKYEALMLTVNRTHSAFKGINPDILYMKYLVSNIKVLNLLGEKMLRNHYAKQYMKRTITANIDMINKKHMSWKSTEMYHEEVAASCLDLIRSFQNRESSRIARIRTLITAFEKNIDYSGLISMTTIGKEDPVQKLYTEILSEDNTEQELFDKMAESLTNLETMATTLHKQSAAFFRKIKRNFND